MAHLRSQATMYPLRDVRRRPLRMPALGFLDAHSVAEASPEARTVLGTAPLCPTCRRVLRQLYDRLGTTLYFDDDPAALLRAFDMADRTDCALRLLAACIVEFGRPRQSVAGAAF